MTRPRATWLLFLLIFAAAFLLCGLLPGCREPQEAEELTFPRRALVMGRWEQLDIATLSHFEHLVGHVPPHLALRTKTEARALGYAEWVDRCLWVHVWGPFTMEPEKLEHAPTWWRPGEHPEHALEKYLHDRWQEDGQDCFLRTEGRRPCYVWGDKAVLDCSPASPVIDYMVSDEWVSMFTDTTSLFRQAYDCVQLEDGQFHCLLPCWPYFGEYPIQTVDGQWWDCDELQAHQCANAIRLWRGWAYRASRAGMIFRTNGPFALSNPHPGDDWWWIRKVCPGAKLERYGAWGGWPHDDIRIWAHVYIEEMPEYCQMQWVTLCGTVSIEKTPAERDSVGRLLLSACLMHDGAFSWNWVEDHEAWSPLGLPPEFPEMRRPLGRSVAPSQSLADEVGRRIYWRHFAYLDERRKVTVPQTVVHNPYEVELFGIPRQSGVWMQGHWYPQLLQEEWERFTEEAPE